MHAKNDRLVTQPSAVESRGSSPLAQSALTGEARLRELEHLADTARKVRDQAASELTRNSGASHHVARERMAAAERMLQKTRQEIDEVRKQLSTSEGAASDRSATQTKDFELAVLLGHSPARFNLDSGSQLTLQEHPVSRRNHEAKSTSGKRRPRSPSLWRTLTFGLLVAAGIGIAVPALYGLMNSGTPAGAAQAVRDSTTHIVDRLRDLLTLPNETARSAVSLG